MNNKLLKRLLMTTALGAVSFAGINEAAATAVLAGGAGTPANNATINYEFSNPNGILNLDGLVNGDTIGFGNAPTQAGGKIVVTNLAAPAAGINITFANPLDPADAANAVDIDMSNATKAITYNFKNAAGSFIRNIDFGAAGARTVSFNNTATVGTLKGTSGTFLATGAAANVTVAGTDAAGIDKFNTDNATSYLTITGNSKATNYEATDGTIEIQADSAGKYTATAATSVIKFNAANSAINANGDASLGNANAELTFTTAAANAIKFAGNVTGNGVVSATGDGEVTIVGNIGTPAAGPAAVVPVAQVVVNGAAGTNLILSGVSYATKYTATLGKITIQNNSNGNYTVDDVANGAGIVFDSTTNAINATGNAVLAGVLNGANSTLTFTGPKAISFAGTINGAAANNGNLVISSAGLTSFTGAIGGTGALASLTIENGAKAKFAAAATIGGNVNLSGESEFAAAFTVNNNGNLTITKDAKAKFTGPVNVGVVGANGNLTITDNNKTEFGAAVNVVGNLVLNGTTQQAFTNDVTAAKFLYTDNVKITLDSTKNPVTATGAFTGTGTVETKGANNATITGAFAGGTLNVGTTGKAVTLINGDIVGANNASGVSIPVAINFTGATQNVLNVNGNIGTVANAGANLNFSTINLDVDDNTGNLKLGKDSNYIAVAAGANRIVHIGTLSGAAGKIVTDLIVDDNGNTARVIIDNVDGGKAKAFYAGRNTPGSTLELMGDTESEFGYGAKVATLKIFGKSKITGTDAKAGYYAPAAGTIIIHNDSEGNIIAGSLALTTPINVAATTGNIIFNSSKLTEGKSFTHQGDATLYGTSSLAFQGGIGAQAKNTIVNFSGNVIAGDFTNTSTINAGMGGNYVIAGNVGKAADTVNKTSLAGVNSITVTSDAADAVSTQLTLQGNSFASSYVATGGGALDKQAILTFDSSLADVTHTVTKAGTGFNSKDANNLIQTIGANNVNLVGAIIPSSNFQIGANTTISEVLGGAGNIKFTADNVAFNAPKAINGATIDFGGKSSIIALGGGDSTLGAITNTAAGSTVKVTTDDNLILSIITGDANNQLLAINASAVKDKTKSVTVQDGSFLGSVDSGAGSFKMSFTAAPALAPATNIVTVGSLTAPEAVYANNNGTLVINKDFTKNPFNTNIKVNSVANVEQNLTFAANGTVASEELRLKTLTVNAGKTVSFDAKGTEKYSIGDINVNGTTVLASNLTNQVGNLNVAQSGIINLNTSTLTLKAGDASFIAGSNLLVNEGGLLNLQGASKIADNSKIIVTLDKDALKEKKGETKIIQAGGSANVTLANITVINSNKWVKDTILGKDVSGKSSTDTATINSVWIQRDLNGALIKTDLTDMIASGSLTSSSKQIADQLVLMNLENSTGDARAFFMGAEGDKKAAIESLKPKSTSLPQAEILQVQQAAMSTVSSVLNERMAVGASDDLKAKAGIWVRGTYGKGKRQASSDYSTSAYNTEIGAGTIGVEAVIGENAVIGVAGTYAQTTIDYKDARDGDQDIFKSMIGSIYGAGTLSNNVVLNGSLIFANSDIEGKVKDLKDTDTAKDPKISAVSYGGTALIGYKVDMSGFSVTPLIGARFGVYTDPARKTGGGFANANEFTDTRVDVAFGLSASGEVKASDMVLVPELHTFGYYNVKGDKATRSVTLEGLPGDSTLTYDDKISKFQVNVGTSLTAKVGMVDYGAGVDGIFEDKSWFVQGAIKLRVSL